jgi:hypothetical protein
MPIKACTILQRAIAARRREGIAARVTKCSRF